MNAENITMFGKMKGAIKRGVRHDITAYVDKKAKDMAYALDFDKWIFLANKNLIMVSRETCIKILGSYDGGGHIRDKGTQELLDLIYKAKFDKEAYVLALTLKVIERLKDKAGHMGKVLWDLHFEGKTGGLFSPTNRLRNIYALFYQPRGLPIENVMHATIFTQDHTLLDFDDLEGSRSLESSVEKSIHESGSHNNNLSDSEVFDDQAVEERSRSVRRTG